MTGLRAAAVLGFATLVACSGGRTNVPAAAAAQERPAPSHPTGAAAPASTPNGTTVSGTVAETMNSGGYSYMRLQTEKGDIWVAAGEFPVKTGERVTASLEMPMQNFHSNTLNRDFPLIYFVPAVAREGESQAPAGQPDHMSGRPPASATPIEPVAPAPGGMSIADIWAKRASLAGKRVSVRGKVVKVNNEIMGRNWLHLQDGSGSASDGTNDLTVTTSGEAKVGDIVTASGVLAVKKDFGAGYSYGAILENATLTAK